MVWLALLLAGCPSARRPPPAAPGEPGALPAVIAPPGPGVARYRIDPAESLVAIVARRGGALAAFGHNHVIAARTMAGVIDLREPLVASRLELHLSVAGFTVDEPALRSGRGEDFPDVVPDEDRAATRRNMLGKDLLDAAQHPDIVVRLESLAGGPQHFAARLAVVVRDARRVIDVPVTLARRSAGLLQLSARFPLDQTALGLVPYSALLGALKVENTLDIEVDLSARRVP